MSEIDVVVTENGPYRVTGTVRLLDHRGEVVDAPSSPVYLCRCGASARKPFCDGSHARVGFGRGAIGTGS